MANKRIPKRRKKRKQKVTHSTSHAPLCALGEVLKEKAFFEPIHQAVDIHQKTIAYRPTDKLGICHPWHHCGGRNDFRH